MTDEQIQKEGQCRECCGPLALDGNCYNSECVLRVATDNTIPLADAVRAYRDRPSMERELSALRAKCQRYEAALRRLDEWGVDDTDKWNQEHPNEEGLYLFDAEAMCAFAEWALNKEEK